MYSGVNVRASGRDVPDPDGSQNQPRRELTHVQSRFFSSLLEVFPVLNLTPAEFDRIIFQHSKELLSIVIQAKTIVAISLPYA